MNKIRFWLIRKLLGADKIDKVAKTAQADIYLNFITFVSNRLAEDSKKYTNDFLAQTIGSFEPKLLASAVLVNNSLTDSQKTQIAQILQSPKAANTSYLG